jgi:hypothetical protein
MLATLAARRPGRQIRGTGVRIVGVPGCTGRPGGTSEVGARTGLARPCGHPNAGVVACPPRRRCDDGRVSEQSRAVFRVPPLAVLGAVLLAVCATPVAFGAPFFWLIYLVPVAVVVWVLRVRTVADADALTVRRLVGTRRVPWSEISSLRLRDRGGVRAVLTDGAELPLPSVRIRDLPQLAAASGGHLTLGDV